MPPGAISAICFDLDNTLWEIEPVLMRAERILADWLKARYPRIAERFTAAEILEVRAALARQEPHLGHDLTYLRRETIARLGEAVGYERGMAQEAFAHRLAARNQVEPFAEVIPALEKL
jgi:putative hydrolase of the HAD superfamily